MRGPERSPARIGHNDGLAGSSLAAIEKVAREYPGMAGCDAVGPFPINPDGVQVLSLASCQAPRRIASSRAIRSSVDGWVENRRMRVWPENGLMMNKCAVAGFTSCIEIYLDTATCCPTAQ